MLIWTHVAIGYLLLSLASHYWLEKEPAAIPTLAMTVGTLFPDIVDKSLALASSTIPSRSLAHSVFTTVIILVLIWRWASERRDRRWIAVAGSIGYLSHLGADSVDYFVLDHGTLRFLFWPLLSPESHIQTVSDLLHLLDPTLYVVVQSVITAGAIALWIHDGSPGVTLLRSQLYRIRLS